MVQVFLAEDPEIEQLLLTVPPRPKINLIFCNDLFSLWFESVWECLQHNLTLMAHKADAFVILARTLGEW